MTEPTWWAGFRAELLARGRLAPLNAQMLNTMGAEERGDMLVLRSTGDIPLGNRLLVAYVAARLAELRLFRGTVVNGDLDVVPRRS